MVLTTVRDSDPEGASRSLPGITRRLLPLTQNSVFHQAELQIGCVRLVVVKRPPCISEAYLEQSQIGIAILMGKSPGLKIDCLSLDQPAMVSHGLSIPHRIFQPSKLTIGAVLLPQAYGEDRWPERDKGARVDPVRPKAVQQLRSVINETMSLASRNPASLSQDNVRLGVQQTVRGAIDDAFLTPQRSAGLATKNYVRTCRIADEFLLANPKRLGISEDIAAAAGVTIRTLHNAMVAVYGMSLSKYLLLQRLWSVRAALRHAGPGDLVKTIALDHGFWHFGRFANTYRDFFGETPSDTLVQKMN
jgi:AraC-like DNA-binding protein